MLKFIPFIKKGINENGDDTEGSFIMCEQDQQKIIKMFNYLRDSCSFISVLQKNYNHSYHYTTTTKDLDFCTEDHWDQIVQKANSETDTIYVEGTKHSNYHTSFTIRNMFTGQPEFCKDTYIRIMDPQVPNRIYHILTTFPETRHPYITIHPNPYYEYPDYILGVKPILR